MLEELTKFEMELPARCGPSVYVDFIQTVPQVDPDRSERADNCRPESERAEKSRGIELTWAVPHVAALEKCIQIERLANPQSEFSGARKEGISKRRALDAAATLCRGVESARRDGEFLIATELLSVLSYTQRERMTIKERTRIAEYHSRSRSKSENECHRRGPERCDTDSANRSV